MNNNLQACRMLSLWVFLIALGTSISENELLHSSHSQCDLDVQRMGGQSRQIIMGLFGLIFKMPSLFNLKGLLFLFHVCRYFASEHVCILCVCLVPQAVRREHRIPGSYSWRKLQATVHMLETKPKSPLRAAMPLNC